MMAEGAGLPEKTGIPRGRIHSIQSLGAVDGPGLRSVVFLQGCPLRCVYCHNPDTWERGDGTEQTPEEVLGKILRFRPYWGKHHAPGMDYEGGGVTVSGGEPLLQPEFVENLFSLLHENGIHTALDTSGAGNMEQAEKVLRETDLVLLDLKFLSEDEYRKYCRGSLKQTTEFLKLTEAENVPVRIRHVAVPGMTAEPEYMKKIRRFSETFSNVQQVEFLPFHNMCLEKYERLGIPFPLKDTRVMGPEEWKALLEKI